LAPATFPALPVATLACGPEEEPVTEERSNVAERKHIRGLTGLRGIGALWVVLFHLTFGRGIPVIDLGFLGVDLFFILSGFVLSYVSITNIDTVPRYLEFLRQRLTRIYPLHLFTLCILAMIVLFVPGFSERYNVPRFEPDAFVASLLLIQNWFYWLPGCWNAPSWSLSAEWFAYLTFPICQFFN
jgi:peptidoglycan/LPS O-acetylase OafA/YrhL